MYFTPAVFVRQENESSDYFITKNLFKLLFYFKRALFFTLNGTIASDKVLVCLS